MLVEPKKARTNFRYRLRQLRDAAGLSQHQLAGLAGLSAQSLSLLERGAREPSWETVLKLALALGVSVAEFSGGEVLDRKKLRAPRPPKKPRPE